MKNRSILTIALCTSGLLLASCGGSSGSDDSSPATSGTPDEQMPEVVSMVGDENMETDQETDPNASVSSILCASNTPTSTSVIGNNLFVFEAATGQCFGRAEEAANLDKRLVPVTATQAVDDGIGEPLLTVPAQGRVVIGRVVSASDPDSAITSDTFIIDLSNTHSLSLIHISEPTRPY